MWLVDPLCGTLNYAVRNLLASVNVALQDGEQVAVAASADPFTHEVFWTDGAAAYVHRGGRGQELAPSAECRLVDVNSTRRAKSILSYRSNGSIPSIYSTDSVLSLGSYGSVLSVGSIGSSGSIGSAGSYGSVLAIGAFGSFWTVGSFVVAGCGPRGGHRRVGRDRAGHQARGGVDVDRRRPGVMRAVVLT